MAIEADSTFNERNDTAGEKGMAAARAMGMITYRNYRQFINSQTDIDHRKLTDFTAASYIRHQGKKLARRFNAFSYYTLTQAMDTHNVSRNRAETVEDVLKNIQQPTLIFSMNDDMLCPYEEQSFLAEHIPHSKLLKIDTHYGHDGFLVETRKIAHHLQSFLMNDKVHYNFS
jgi:homoserine O-acetyltransferase